LGECQIVATSTVTENSANQSSPAVFQDLGGEEDNHDDEERDRPHPISGARVYGHWLFVPRTGILSRPKLDGAYHALRRRDCLLLLQGPGDCRRRLIG